MKCVIFAGGAGTRLWPLSRKKSPKQFEKIIGDNSTLQHAVLRLQPDFPWEDIYVSTGAQYVSYVHEQLPELPHHHVIGEPEMRDVGPAVGLLTSILAKESPNEPMAILWSDHMVKKDAVFRKLLLHAGKLVENNPDSMIFIAQKPRFASENLGWIEYGKPVKKINGIDIYAFKKLHYRPDKETAKVYLKSGNHAWNLGYFVTTPAFLWKQYKAFVPHLYNILDHIGSAWGTESFEKVLKEKYPTCEKISFDNAILEHIESSKGLVISEDIGWSDIGAWEALKEALQESSDKNVTQGNVLLSDTNDSLIYNFTNQMLVAIDVEDMIVVSTDDIIMVCKKSSVPKIKPFVESLKGTEHDHLI